MTSDVIVVTWRSGERVLACLDRLRAESRPHRTIVVDNASKDGTLEAVRERFPEVDSIELGRNLGFGAAVNAGAAHGHGEALVLINDDVQIQAGCLDELVSLLERDPHCGMVAGLTTIPGRELIDSFGIELDATLAAYNRGRLQTLDDQRLGLLAMPSGGLACYRRVAFEQAGGFDERLIAYGEDVDLGLRLRAAGWSAAAAPRARGVHLGGASIGVDSPLQRELGGFARGFLLRRYGVMRTRHAPRALAFEALVVGWGVLAHRTLVPLRSRVRGARSAAGARLAVSEDCVDRSITARAAFARIVRDWRSKRP